MAPLNADPEFDGPHSGWQSRVMEVEKILSETPSTAPQTGKPIAHAIHTRREACQPHAVTSSAEPDATDCHGLRLSCRRLSAGQHTSAAQISP